MFKRTLFGSVKSDDGFTFGIEGRNALVLKRGSAKYYVFIEPLAIPHLTFQMDRTGVWLDKKFGNYIHDKARNSAYSLRDRPTL